MNNLGVALLMVNRRDEAVYWFKNAVRYGDRNASATLVKLKEQVPPADLVGKHPSQQTREAAQQALAIVAVGVLIGVTAYYTGKNGGSGYANSAYQSNTGGQGAGLASQTTSKINQPLPRACSQLMKH
jgi:hypothetical protein